MSHEFPHANSSRLSSRRMSTNASSPQMENSWTAAKKNRKKNFEVGIVVKWSTERGRDGERDTGRVTCAVTVDSMLENLFRWIMLIDIVVVTRFSGSKWIKY